MTSAVPAGKKTAICRYFANTGTCIYGDECQFFHQNPNAQLRNSYSNGPSSQGGDANDGMTEPLTANNGDQFFNATFNPSHNIPEFQPFLAQQRMRTRNSIMRGLAHQSPGGGTAGGMGPNGALTKNMMQNAPRIDSNIANDFASLNLATTANSAVPPSSMMGNEFVPKAGLTHSASSPAFSSYHQVSSMSSIPVSINNHINSNTMALPSGASPNHSPHLSPSNSPLLIRRNNDSPVVAKNTPTPTTTQPANATIQEYIGGTTYFYKPEDFTTPYQGVVLPNFSMYPGMPPHIAHMKLKANMPQFSMPDEIKMEVLNRHALTLAQVDLSQNTDIPSEIDNYHNLFPLEPRPANPHQKSSTFGYPTSVYKAVNSKDGLTYCLRRIHGYRLPNTKCMTLTDMWKKMYHPNIIQLREVFTTKAFGDNSIVFVYDFHPAADTLMARHFSNASPMNGYTNPYEGSSNRPFSAKGVNGSRNQNSSLLPESLIWAYIVQLSSSLRAIHAAGLACRAMDPSKILITSKSRLRLNCVGIFDVLTFDSSQGNPLAVMPHYQQEDLMALGKVVLALACNSVLAVQRDHLQTSIELVQRNYSPDLKNLIWYLLTNQNRPRSINDIMPMIGARFYTQLDSAQLRTDVIENELAKEVENGRLMKLMCKLSTILERPEFHMDPAWSETGDRYMLKLFRDYCFHQVDETGAPWIDMAHITQCLNKIDAGAPEKICLMSRDEQNVIVVSYAELKRCFETAFSEMLGGFT